MKIDIDYLVRLSNIPLNEEEKSKYSKQIEGVIEFIDKLNELDTSNVEPTYQVTGQLNIMRADEVNPSLTVNDAIRNSQRVDNGKIVTKGVFEDE